MNNKRYSAHSYHSGNSKGLGALCQELGRKTKYIFPSISLDHGRLHNHWKAAETKLGNKQKQRETRHLEPYQNHITEPGGDHRPIALLYAHCYNLHQRHSWHWRLGATLTPGARLDTGYCCYHFKVHHLKESSPPLALVSKIVSKCS